MDHPIESNVELFFGLLSSQRGNKYFLFKSRMFSQTTFNFCHFIKSHKKILSFSFNNFGHLSS